VVHDSWRWPSIINRALQSTNRQLGLGAPAKRPANALGRHKPVGDDILHSESKRRLTDLAHALERTKTMHSVQGAWSVLALTLEFNLNYTVGV